MNSINETLNETTNFTEPVVSANIFGPQRDSLLIVIPITIIYCSIFISGIVGNIFTCIVIVRNKSMHTATNYYLFSLAISDLLLLISGMPQEMYSIWSKWPYVFGNTFCVLRGLAAETSTNASVLTITLFTAERYLAICHPFVSHKMSKLSRATKHVVWLWVVALSLALPQALQFGIRETKGVIMCLQTRIIIPHSFEVSTFLFFLAPMILISVLYALIGLKLKKTSICNEQGQRNFQRCLANTEKLRRKYSQSTRRVIKMLVAVVIAFFVCWAPFHAQRLVAIYGTTENHLARSPILLATYYYLTYISGVLYYLSTCINPFFYHLMSNKFRDAFKDSAKPWCYRRPQDVSQRCPYTAIALAKNRRTSSATGSGNSQRNDPMSRTKRQDSGDRIKGPKHLCGDVGLVTSENQDFIYKQRFNNDKESTHFEDMKQDLSHERRCISACCVDQETPIEMVTIRPCQSSSSVEIIKLCTVNPVKRSRQMKGENEYG